MWQATIPTPAFGLTIGGWDQVRGGGSSIFEPALQPIRDLIEQVSPGAKLTATNELTPAYLATVDVVILGAGYSNFLAIAPLTAAEQAALLAFVQEGGNLSIILEHEFHGGPTGDATRESLINPFWLQTEGKVGPLAVFIDVSHPTANGPFGAITQYATNAAGYFSELGPWAEALSVDSATSQPVAAVIERSVVAPGSGRVLFNGDASSLLSVELVGNSLAYLLPGPADANQNDLVDGADYTVWADNFLRTDARFWDGDFTGDRIVDGADYTVWADKFAPSHLQASVVPEPSSLVLGGSGIILGLLMRRW